MASKPSRAGFIFSKRRSLRAPFLLCWVLALIGGVACAADHLKRFDLTRPAMGTQFRLTFYAKDAETAAQAAEAAFQRVAELEQVGSDYRPDSELTLLNQSTEHKASPDLFRVLQRSLELARLSEGAFDVTAGHYSQLWRRAKRKGELPSAQQLGRVRPLVGWQLISMDASSRVVRLAKPGMQLDLGGIAKGFAADAALKVLAGYGITAATIAASGDLAIGDPPPGEPEGWEVRLRTFESEQKGEGEFPVTLKLARCGVSTSGDLHQFVEIAGTRYSHIVDPQTGLGLTRRVAATVIAPDATTSDALATAVCILDAGRAAKLISAVPDCKARVVSLKDGGEIETQLMSWPDTSDQK